MEEIPGIGFFAGSQVVRRIEDDIRVEITISAVPQDYDVGMLLSKGWNRLGPNVFEYVFPVKEWINTIWKDPEPDYEN